MPNPRACPFCREKSKNPDAKGIDYKDVNLLRKFISDRG
ncbi:MAG: 30S ribosomal protein S18, partial [Candidatus Nanopelagicales bacterium]